MHRAKRSGAIVLGIALLVFALRFAVNQTPLRASALFYATIAYLPLLLTVMMIDKA